MWTHCLAAHEGPHSSSVYTHLCAHAAQRLMFSMFILWRQTEGHVSQWSCLNHVFKKSCFWLQQPAEPKPFVQTLCKCAVWMHVFACINVQQKQTGMEKRKAARKESLHTDWWMAGMKEIGNQGPPGTASASVPLIRAARSDRKLARGCERPHPSLCPTRQHGGHSGITHMHVPMFQNLSDSQKTLFFFFFDQRRLLMLVSCQTTNSEIGHGATMVINLSQRTQKEGKCCCLGESDVSVITQHENLTPLVLPKHVKASREIPTWNGTLGTVSSQVMLIWVANLKTAEVEQNIFQAWSDKKHKICNEEHEARQTRCWRSTSSDSQRTCDQLQKGLEPFFVALIWEHHKSKCKKLEHHVSFI